MNLHTSLILLVLLPTTALAHGSHAELHVGNAYDSCYIDLHEELTQKQFRTFTREGAAVVRFTQFAPAQGLGAGRWSFDVGRTSTPINDEKGAWNNTFSHPGDDHYLGDVQQIPRLAVHYGLNERLDVGFWGTINPASNYGFVGVDTKVTLLDSRIADLPVHLAARPSVTTVLGPSEAWFGNAALDLTASVTWGGFTPYIGAGGTVGAAVERSRDVDLDPVFTLSPVAVTGAVFRLWHFHVGAEATWSEVQTYGVVLGAEI